MILYIIYTIILLFLSILLFIDFFREKSWKKQLSIAFILLIFVLRILQIK